MVAALAAAPLSFSSALPAAATPAAADVVISEVYGAGGNSGATYNADFVEVLNPTSAPIDLTGMALQYRSGTGVASVSPFSLSGSLGAGDTYLVRMSATGANGAALPTPDATASPAFAMSGSDGQVLLTKTTTAFAGSGDVAGNPALVDAVGYGDTATTFEGARTGVDLTATTSAQRGEVGGDTDVNASDFSELAPTPDAIPDEPDVRTIAQVQGTGTTSPEAGNTVRTTGVVTARYPTGGFNGFFIQTGGAPDTAGASDGVFVYSPSIPGGSYPALGASVEVVGEVSEYFGVTQITLETFGPTAVLPAVTPLAASWTELDSNAEKESHEGELVAPSGAFTVTDSYDTDNYGEITLAAGTTPLVQPTDVVDAQTGDVDAIEADNAARVITLDDAASLNFRDGANADTPYPWLTPTNPVRAGAAVTFTGNVVLDFRNNHWKLQPTRRVTGDGSTTATFTNTRKPAPEAVGGDVRLATFNVLNYFPTTGEEFDARPGTTCSFYTDRDGNRTTVNSCNPDGPRGAADAANLARQQAKIVRAINALDASIVSLEELENSVKLGKDRDFAIGVLVDALNADAGADTWAFAPSPAARFLPDLAEQDVIRTGFIYRPADVDLVGPSKVLTGSAAFANAREPLAQAFTAAGTGNAHAFAVIVNHFKSKGSGTPDPDGQGNATVDRVAQAQALSDFAAEFSFDRQIDAVFLAGDFNAYTEEDPMQVLYDDGYSNLDSTTDPAETSYFFDGLAGSLDHVVANEAALALVTGMDIWNINAEEPVAYEYSRYNANATLLFDPGSPYRASDHNPEIVGLDLAGVGPEDVQILATNDFHGRLSNNSNAEAGAAVLAGAVKQLRAAEPDTVFAAAGDLIGASTFDSFIQDDKPTIDALNEAGLEVSAVGNHEFDKGYDDLINRIMADYDAETNPRGGAAWQYIGANVRIRATGDPAVPATWIKDFGDVEVGFVGAVTEDLTSLVSPAGIAELEVTDIVAAANSSADDLEAQGADVIVLLVHEGATSRTYAAATDDSAFGSIVNGVDGNIDAIVSGHTHLAYNHSVPVPEWVSQGREVTERPVVSAGQYGMALNKLVFTVDAATGEVLAKTQEILDLETCTSGCTGSSPVWSPVYPSDPATARIVADAVAQANVLGAQPLGQVAGPFFRAKLADTTTENRGGESTLGNLVAEVQRWATETPEAGGSQIAFMNPGGLRADLTGTLTGEDRVVTYRQAANVQSFANTLVNMDLTGADIKAVLEQQWQRNADNTVPSRPFLKLGVSEGFLYTYDPAQPEGSRITSMTLDGVAIDPAQTYSVTANSFLASGGDNFRAFTTGTDKRDTGKVDLQTMVDYLAEVADTGAGDAPLPVDFRQRAVGVSFAAGAPSDYAGGETVAFDVSSWSFTGPGDAKDTEVVVSYGDTALGAFPLDNAAQAAPPGFDETGRASVSVVLPADVSAGTQELTLAGAATGTRVVVPVSIADDAPAVSTATVIATPMSVRVKKDSSSLAVTITSDDGTPTPTGVVQAWLGGSLLDSAELTDGAATLTVGPFDSVGDTSIEVRYLGDDTTAASTTTVTLTVQKQRPSMTISVPSVVSKSRPVTARVALRADNMVVMGNVRLEYRGRTLTKKLTDGAVTVALGSFQQTGRVVLEVTYAGNGTTESVTRTRTFRVVR